MCMREKSIKTCFIFSNLSEKSRGNGRGLTSDLHLRLTFQCLSPHPFLAAPTADAAPTPSSPTCHFLPTVSHTQTEEPASTPGLFASGLSSF